MMKSAEADEVLAIADAVGPVILSATIPPIPAKPGTALRRAVGMMMADPNMSETDYFAYVLSGTLELARQCNATVVTMDRVRKAALDMTPRFLPGTLAKHNVIRLTLAAEARIIATMTFRSRDEVDQIAQAMNAAFAESEEIASDETDQGTYMALINLHGAVVKHLTDIGRQVPRVITYSFQTVMPALRMAQRAYHNAARYKELIDENKVVHPAFVPQEGKMLAV